MKNRVTYGYDSYGNPYFQVVGLSPLNTDEKKREQLLAMHEAVRVAFESSIQSLDLTYPQE